MTVPPPTVAPDPQARDLARADPPGSAPDRHGSRCSPGRPFGPRGALATYLGFFLGTVLATWPLVLDLPTSWPIHHDPRLFTWVMASVARGLVSRPWSLFHGSGFYPYGQSLGFSEILVPPSVLGLPGFLWGNPVLTYNLLLLTLWPLNGLAMAWVAHTLAGSRAAAWLAGGIFCLSPYFTEYHVEFQMLLAAPVPVAMLAWVRWLETQSPRWLALALAALTAQALTTWYYGIILGMAFVALSVAFLCLRWDGWTWRADLAALGVGGASVAAILLPFALPYLVIRRELGFERDLGETASHSADLATFIEPGDRSLLYRFSPSGHAAETSAFVGFIVLVLAATSLLWLAREHPRSGVSAWIGRALLVALVATGPALAWAIAFPRGRYPLGPLTIRPRVAEILYLALGLAVALLLLRGLEVHRARTPRRLGHGDWVRVLLLLTATFATLALGPVIRVGGRAIGAGPYLTLYQFLFPLHAVRITTRFAVVSIAALALLAALGLHAIEGRLRGRPGRRRLVLGAVFVGLALEYAVGAVPYQPVAWAGRPVDGVLGRDPGDVAVLEWPLNMASADADAAFRSLIHGKRVVNGHSGFIPSLIPELSGLLTERGPPFPVPEAQAALRRIYPLRYLVVRLAEPGLRAEWRPVWRALRDAPPPVLRFRGTFGDDDLYEIVPLPERGTRLQRWVSYDFLRAHPVLQVAVRSLASASDHHPEIEILLNDRLIARLPGETRTGARLEPPFHLAAPNVITIQYRSREPGLLSDSRLRIGGTGASSPADLRVRSAGRPHHGAASILLDGHDVSPGRRGYNLVAVNPAGGLLGAAAFDTFGRADAAGRLAAWVAALPRGTITAGSVRDEGSVQLTEPAVAALRTLGVAGDLRGRFRESHAFIGVKGAPPGSALEALGPRVAEVSVGRPPEEMGIELTEFALLPTPPAR